MKDAQVIEMIQMLLEMSTDIYLQFKYTMQAVSKGHHTTDKFVDKLFSLTDERRPLLIGMKGGI